MWNFKKKYNEIKRYLDGKNSIKVRFKVGDNTVFGEKSIYDIAAAGTFLNALFAEGNRLDKKSGMPFEKEHLTEFKALFSLFDEGGQRIISGDFDTYPKEIKAISVAIIDAKGNEHMLFVNKQFKKEAARIQKAAKERECEMKKSGEKKLKAS